MRERRFRNKVTWMGFLLSALVIWIHAYNADIFAMSGNTPAGSAQTAQAALAADGRLWQAVLKIEDFVSNVVGSLAVPGFFMISSYLFFRNYDGHNVAKKWKERFFSVAVPYFAWNLLYYLGYVIIPRLPVIGAAIGKAPAPLTLRELLMALLFYRYAPVLWFLFQLIVLFAISPVIYAIVRKKALGIAYLAVLMAAVHFHIDTRCPNTDALLYYSFAAFAAVHARRIAEETESGCLCLTGCVCLLAVAGAAAFLRYPYTGVLNIVLIRLLGFASLWTAAGGWYLPEAKPFMRQGMFVYANHFITVRAINKMAVIFASSLSAFIMGTAPGIAAALRPVMAIMLYLAMPAIAVGVSYAAALFLDRHMPAVWKILSGGRGLMPPDS